MRAGVREVEMKRRFKREDRVAPARTAREEAGCRKRCSVSHLSHAMDTGVIS